MRNKIQFMMFYLSAINCFGASLDFFESESLISMEKTKELLEETRQYVEKAFRQADQDAKNCGDHAYFKISLDVSEAKDGVKVVVGLPKGFGDKDLPTKVDLEAKSNSLDGTVRHGKYIVKIAITDGQVAQVSYKYSSKEEDVSKNGKHFAQISSMSTQSVVLPVPVDNLENAKATFRDNKLILILPKKESIARGWRRIEVK